VGTSITSAKPCPLLLNASECSICQPLSLNGLCRTPQGVWLRDYTPVEERRNSDSEFTGETLGRVRPSNAYQRRIAGTNWH